MDEIREQTRVGDLLQAKGDAILLRWKERRLSSRRILREVFQACDKKDRLKTPKARWEAYALLLALEGRIRERYASLLFTLFHYFAWKRETAALQSCRFLMGIEQGLTLREAIEIEEREGRIPLSQESEESDENASGGKRQGREEEPTAGKDGKEPQSETKDGEGKQAEEKAEQEQPQEEAQSADEAQKDPAERQEKNNLPEEQEPQSEETAEERSKDAEPKQEKKEESAPREEAELKPDEPTKIRTRTSIDLNAVLPPPVPLTREESKAPGKEAWFPRYSEALGTDLDVIATEASFLRTEEGRAVMDLIAQSRENGGQRIERIDPRLFGEGVASLREGAEAQPRQESPQGASLREGAQPRQEEVVQPRAEREQASTAQTDAQAEHQIGNDEENRMRDEITRNMNEEQLTAFRTAMEAAAQTQMQEQTAQFLNQNGGALPDKMPIHVSEATEPAAPAAQRVEAGHLASAPVHNNHR